MLILNDSHIGTIRSAGTTPKSALALRGFLLDSLESQLKSINEDLIVLGDLFDTHTIPLTDWLRTYQLFQNWLLKGHNLWLVAGNHDLSTDSSKLSHFQLLGTLLKEHINVQYIEGGEAINDDIYVISHVPNQDLFDYELSKVPKCKYLLVHANYDNDFAKEADHSLNLSRQQIEKLPVDTVFFAHEHYYREDMQGKVFVGGNQMPASISDCLHKEMKCMHRLTDKGVQRIQTWDAADYVEMNWTDLQPTEARFIRFVGHCTPEQAVEMTDLIVRYRRGSDAFIVGNAVRVGTDSEKEEEFTINTLERVRAFSVMEALKKYLTAEELTLIETLPK